LAVLNTFHRASAVVCMGYLGLAACLLFPRNVCCLLCRHAPRGALALVVLIFGFVLIFVPSPAC